MRIAICPFASRIADPPHREERRDASQGDDGPRPLAGADHEPSEAEQTLAEERRPSRSSASAAARRRHIDKLVRTQPPAGQGEAQGKKGAQGGQGRKARVSRVPTSTPRRRRRCRPRAERAEEVGEDLEAPRGADALFRVRAEYESPCFGVAQARPRRCTPQYPRCHGCRMVASDRCGLAAGRGHERVFGRPMRSGASDRLAPAAVWQVSPQCGR